MEDQSEKLQQVINLLSSIATANPEAGSSGVGIANETTGPTSSAGMLDLTVHESQLAIHV